MHLHFGARAVGYSVIYFGVSLNQMKQTSFSVILIDRYEQKNFAKLVPSVSSVADFSTSQTNIGEIVENDPYYSKLSYSIKNEFAADLLTISYNNSAAIFSPCLPSVDRRCEFS